MLFFTVGTYPANFTYGGSESYLTGRLVHRILSIRLREKLRLECSPSRAEQFTTRGQVEKRKDQGGEYQRSRVVSMDEKEDSLSGFKIFCSYAGLGHHRDHRRFADW